MANATITVLEADGTTQTDVVVLDIGRQAAAASKSVAASTEDKAVLDAIAASLALLDNSISAGNELQVDVVAALPAGDNNIGNVDLASSIPAGTNNIGDVDIASIAAGDNNIGNVDVVSLPALAAGTNNIGDVDVLSLIPGTGATNLGKAEDAVHASGDVGVMALGVRQDAQVDFGADGDYVPFSVDADGGLRVSIVAGAGSGGTAAADDADFTAGTTSGTPAMGVYESTPTSVTDGDLGTVGITSGRRLKTSATVDAALPAGTNNIGDVDVLSVIPGVGATNLGKAEDAVHASGDTGVMALGVRQDAQVDFGADGDYVPFSVDADGGLRVSIVAGAGSGGTSAADDADFVDGTTSGTPIMGVYESTPSTVTDGDMGMVGITTARRLKVNLIEGQAGVSGGSGTVDATTIRTVLASDTINANGRAGAADSAPVVIATEDLAEITSVKTAVQLIDDAIIADDAAFTPATTKVMMAGAEFDDTGTDSVDEGDAGALRMSANRNLYVRIRDNAGNERGLNIDANGAASVTTAATIVDDAAFTPATTSVVMAGFHADEASTDSVTEGDGGAARMTLDRKQIVTMQPHTSGGLLIFRSLDLDETEEEVKATAGCLYKLRITNFAASPRYIKLYNATAAGTTVGTTTPIDTITVPAAAASDCVVITENFGGLGLMFDTALSIAATTGLADNNTGAPAANDVVVSAYYL